PHAAGVGPVEAGDAVEHGRLARPVGADHADDLELPDPNADVVERLEAAEPDRQADGLKKRQRAPVLVVDARCGSARPAATARWAPSQSPTRRAGRSV